LLFTSNMSSGLHVRIRKPAPDFKAEAVINGEFKDVTLSDYKGLLIWCTCCLFLTSSQQESTSSCSFTPLVSIVRFNVLISKQVSWLDFTFVCPTEIIAFSERVKDFEKLGVQLLGASVDSKYSHLAWINTPRKTGGLGGINFPLISDLDHEISKKYGVYIEEDGHTIRGLFLIDKEGLVRQITLNDNPVGRNVDEIIRLVQAFQFNEEHGEVCPVNWVPGKDTMVDHPEKSKSYFAKTFSS